MSNSWIIYTLSNPLNTTDLRYVGATSVGIEKRKLYHIKNAKYNKKSNYHTADWIRNLLKNNLEPKIEILEQCRENNWQDNEIYWINQFKTWGFNLTNTAIGGIGVKNMSQDIKNKISKSNKGKQAWNKNVPMSLLVREKIRKQKKGQIPYNKNKIGKRGIENKNFGKKRSIEVINNIKNGIKNLPLNIKNKIKKAVSEKNSKPVLQYAKNMILLKEWESAKKVQDSININRNHISECCSKKRKSAGGFIWKYKNDNTNI